MPGWQHIEDLLGRQDAQAGSVVVPDPAVIVITALQPVNFADALVTAVTAAIIVDGLAPGPPSIQPPTAAITVTALAPTFSITIPVPTASITIVAPAPAFQTTGSGAVIAITATIVLSANPPFITGVLNSYDQVIGYDLLIPWDGLEGALPPVIPPAPPTTVTLITTAPFGQSGIYILETRTKLGKRVAQLPYFNIQMEDMLNDPGALRCDLPAFHSNVSRLTVEEGVHELWLWRKGTLIFAGPLWQITGDASSKVLHLTASGLLSYFNFRRIDQSFMFSSTTITTRFLRGSTPDLIHNNGPSIAGFFISWTQAKPNGNLHIVDAHTNGLPLRANLFYNWWERLNLLQEIQNLANEEDTGFDYAIDPSTREFRTYSPRRGNNIPGVLEYGANISDYSLPRAASTIVNSEVALGPGDGESMITGFAADTQSMEKYGLMEGEIDAKNVSSSSQASARARSDVLLRRKSSTVPTLTMKGRDLPFIGTFSPGDQTRIRINNGYDQFDKVLRMTGYQLTVGTNDEEAVNVFIEGADAAI